MAEPLGVSWRQVHTFRLARHHLLHRLPASSFITVCGEMGGVQAQLLSAAHLSLWTRVDGLQNAAIEAAFVRRELVKTACMRQTQFIVPASQLAVFVRGSARRAAKDVRWTLNQGVTARDIDAAIDALLAALDQPRTRPEIADLVCRAMGVNPQTIHGGTGWGSRKPADAVPIGHINFPVVYLMRMAAANSVVCSGPNQAGQPTFVRADAYLPVWRDLSPDLAEDKLLSIYLRAFGPATAADFAMWSGITLTEARAIWARHPQPLAALNIEGWQASILAADQTALTQAEFEQPVTRLLPYFDTYLLGHRNRDHLAPRASQPLIYRPQGWISQVVLHDGRAAAIWEYNRVGKSLQIKLNPLETLPTGLSGELAAEAARLCDFLQADSFDLQIA